MTISEGPGARFATEAWAGYGVSAECGASAAIIRTTNGMRNPRIRPPGEISCDFHRMERTLRRARDAVKVRALRKRAIFALTAYGVDDNVPASFGPARTANADSLWKPAMVLPRTCSSASALARGKVQSTTDRCRYADAIP